MDKGRIISGLAIMSGLFVMGAMLPRAVEKSSKLCLSVGMKG